MALACGILLSGCGGSSAPPRHAAGEGSGGHDAPSDSPPIEGTFRIVDLAGQPVVEELASDPSCYAGRALFTFHEDRSLSFALETVCADHPRYDSVCKAELTIPLEWERGDRAFRVPFPARARGVVSQYGDAAELGTPDDREDSCHVGVTAMRWRVRAHTGEALELVNEHGDVMHLEREAAPEHDWREVVQRARLARAVAEQ